MEDVNGFGVVDRNERMRDAATDAVAELFAVVRVHCDFTAYAADLL